MLSPLTTGSTALTAAVTPWNPSTASWNKFLLTSFLGSPSIGSTIICWDIL